MPLLSLCVFMACYWMTYLYLYNACRVFITSTVYPLLHSSISYTTCCFAIFQSKLFVFICKLSHSCYTYSPARHHIMQCFFAMLLLVLFGSMLLCRFYSHIPCPSFNRKKTPLCSVLGPFVIQPKFSDFVSYQFVHFILNLNIFQ